MKLKLDSDTLRLLKMMQATPGWHTCYVLASRLGMRHETGYVEGCLKILLQGGFISSRLQEACRTVEYSAPEKSKPVMVGKKMPVVLPKSKGASN